VLAIWEDHLERALEYSIVFQSYNPRIFKIDITTKTVVLDIPVIDFYVQNVNPYCLNYLQFTEHPMDLKNLETIRDDGQPDLFHINSLSLSKDGTQLMLSLREQSALMIVDIYQKRLVKFIKNDKMKFQHGCKFIEDDTKICIFSNNSRFQMVSPNDKLFSAIYELNLDGEITKTVSESVPMNTMKCNSSLLPNGNTIACLSCFNTIVEYTPDGEVCWKYYASDAPQMYRVEKYSKAKINNILGVNVLEQLDNSVILSPTGIAIDY